MKDKPQFQAGMHTLGTAFNVPVTADHLTIYWRELHDLTDEEFARAVHLAVNEADARFWPPPGRLRVLARPEPDYAVEGAKAFDAILALPKSYNPVIGERISARAVREKLGAAAAEAFTASGGAEGWATTRADEWPFIRKAFLASYAQAAREATRDVRLAALAVVQQGRIGPGGQS